MELSRTVSLLASANQQLSVAHATTLAHLESMYLELKREREINSQDKVRHQGALDEVDKPRESERLEQLEKLTKDYEVTTFLKTNFRSAHLNCFFNYSSRRQRRI